MNMTLPPLRKPFVRPDDAAADQVQHERATEAAPELSADQWQAVRYVLKRNRIRHGEQVLDDIDVFGPRTEAERLAANAIEVGKRRRGEKPW